MSFVSCWCCLVVMKTNRWNRPDLLFWNNIGRCASDRLSPLHHLPPPFALALLAIHYVACDTVFEFVLAMCGVILMHILAKLIPLLG